MVALKPDASLPELAGEVVQLAQIGVRDEMAVVRPAPRPTRFVNEDGHTQRYDITAATLYRFPERVSNFTAPGWHTAMVVLTLEKTRENVETDVISLTIPASMQFVRLVRIGAASLARRRGLPVRFIDDLRLAVDETFSLLLDDRDHPGSVDVTFEIDDRELLVSAVQQLVDGPLPIESERVQQFDIVLADLVDRFEADPQRGVVQFSKKLT